MGEQFLRGSQGGRVEGGTLIKVACVGFGNSGISLLNNFQHARNTPCHASQRPQPPQKASHRIPSQNRTLTYHTHRRGDQRCQLAARRSSSSSSSWPLFVIRSNTLGPREPSPTQLRCFSRQCMRSCICRHVHRIHPPTQAAAAATHQLRCARRHCPLTRPPLTTAACAVACAPRPSAPVRLPPS